MLHLLSETDPEWASRAIAAIDLILLDHAHLEKKAAANALNLMFRYPEQARLLRPLSELAREELGHFELVLEILEERGLRFDRLRPSAYASKLLEVVRSQEPERLLDALLTSAFIEARSCERMKVLAAHLEEERLSTFYNSLLATEARHHRMYVELAEQIFEPAEVSARLAQIAVHEAAVIESLPKEPRLHNG